MTLHGCLITVVLAVCALFQGYDWGMRLEDQRGIIGWTLAALVLAAGITMMLGW